MSTGFGTILGQLELSQSHKSQPHKCNVSAYVHPDRGLLYANEAAKGTVWKCSECGSLWIHRKGGPFYLMGWWRATRRECRLIRKSGLGEGEGE